MTSSGAAYIIHCEDSMNIELNLIRQYDNDSLGVLEELFVAFEREGLRYCHWKSNQHLADAFAGRTDVDLLVDKRQADSCERLLCHFGYKRFVSQPWARYPGIEDWIGFDTKTQKLVHVHLHYQLILGKKYVKEQSLPWEDFVLDTAIKEPNYNVFITDPNLEIILLLIRVALKTDHRSLLGAYLTGRSFLPRNILDEFHYLSTRIEEKTVQAYADELLPPQFSQSLMTIVHDRSFEKPGSIYRLKSLTNSSLVEYRRYDRLQTVGIHAYRKLLVFASRIGWKFNVSSKPGKRLHNTGATIALIGCDGSGKSTISQELEEWLSWKIDVRRLYLGTGDGSVGRRTRILQRMASMAAPKRSATDAVQMEHRNGKPKRFTFRQLGASLLALSIAEDRYRKVMAANRAKMRGAIIVTDRYPQNQFAGIFDGPKLDEARGNHVVQDYFARQEMQKYRAIAECPPTLVIKLHLPAEVALSRKTAHSPDQVRRKATITGRLRFPESEVIDVDASLPLEEVIKTVKWSVWKGLQ